MACRKTHYTTLQPYIPLHWSCEPTLEVCTLQGRFNAWPHANTLLFCLPWLFLSDFSTADQSVTRDTIEISPHVIIAPILFIFLFSKKRTNICISAIYRLKTIGYGGAIDFSPPIFNDDGGPAHASYGGWTEVLPNPGKFCGRDGWAAERPMEHPAAGSVSDGVS